MKKVLILAYDFPPLISIGAQRPYSWFKYFPEMGIEAVVITRHWTDKMEKPEDYIKETLPTTSSKNARQNNIIRTPYLPNLRDRLLLKSGYNKNVFFRKMLSFFYSFLEHLFFSFDSKSNIYTISQKYLASSKVDVIVATGEPFILFKYAHLLSREFNIPWIADYRDGWTTNQGAYRNSFPNKMINYFHAFLEQKYVANALLVTTAAPSYGDQLKKIHPTKNVEVVYNGYFEEHHQNDIPDYNINDYFTITYTGTVYPYQKIETFLKGFKLFLSNNPEAKVKIQFLGLNAGIKSRIEVNACGMSEYITYIGKVSPDESIKYMRNSNLLLLLSAPYINTLASKIFDYLATRRKIMLVENDFGIMENILKETNGGVALATPTEVSKFMTAEYNTHIKLKQKNYIQQSENVEFYSRKKQAIIFLNIIQEKLLRVR